MTETFITLKFIINQTLKQVVSILYSRNSTKKKKKKLKFNHVEKN